MPIATTDTRQMFYTVEKLGPRMERTKQGYLICYDVPVARTGSMLYANGETPVNAAPGERIVTIWRNAEQLFDADTLRSGNGMPVTNEHPREMEVTPATYSHLSKGNMYNTRRGEGELSEFMVADLLITDPTMITDIESNRKREVSLGYTADYMETEPGEGYQTDIIVNHLAVVRSGRCGEQCAIGDHQTVPEHSACKCKERKKEMAKKNNGGIALLDGLLTAVRSRDEKEIKRIATAMTNDSDEDEPAEGGAVHIHVGDKEGDKGNTKWNDEAMDSYMAEHEKAHGEIKKTCDDLTNKVAELENKKADKGTPETAATGDDDISTDPSMDTAEKVADAMEEEAPEGKEKEARKTGDSALLVENFQSVRAMAEIISPGMQVPTLDSKAKRVITLDALCALRRRTLDAALKVPASADIVKAVRGKALTNDTLARLDCRSVRTLFTGVGAAMAQANRTAAARTTDSVPAQGFGEGVGTKPPTNAELNKKYAEFYKDKL